jgi:Ca-activated chloride channel homolog
MVGQIPWTQFSSCLRRKSGISFFLAISLWLIGGMMIPAAPPTAERPVQLNLAVTDKQGTPLETLTEKDFQVEENNKPMSVQSFKFQKNAPVSVGILVDISRSMGNENTRVALQIIKSLAETMKSPDELFIMSFSEEAELVVDFLSPEDYLEEALDHLGSGGPTYMGLAVDRGLAKLREARNPRRILLMISAGRDKAGPATLEHIGRYQVPIYALQMPGTGGLSGVYDSFGSLNIKGSALSVFAEQSGGRHSPVDTLESAQPRVHAYYHEWKNYYQLEYLSPNSKLDGKFRQVSVKAAPGGVEVIHLRKYFIAIKPHRAVMEQVY